MSLKLMGITMLIVIGGLLLAGCGGCNSSTPMPLPDPGGPRGSDPAVEVVSVSDAQTIHLDFPVTKEFKQCDVPNELPVGIRSMYSTEQEAQEALILKVEGTLEMSLSPAVKAAITGAVEQHMSTTNTESRVYEEEYKITIPANAHYQWTGTWRVTRQTGKVQYREDGQPKTGTYSYRSGVELVEFDLKPIDDCDLRAPNTTSNRVRAPSAPDLNPMVDGYRLDWCYQPAAQCGKPAADEWCKTQGYLGASAFEQDVDVGQQGIQTKVLGTGVICSTTVCDSFKSITCHK